MRGVLECIFMEERKFSVVLENIRSLYNVGSVFRTADGLGFEKIYLCGYTPAPEGGRQKESIHKTALGAEEHISWQKNKSCSSLLKNLKKKGCYVIGLETGMKKSVSLKKVKIPKREKDIVLVFGNEVKGLSKGVLNQCDKIVEIEMEGEKDSFNISVSFGMAGFWLKNKD